MTTVILKRGQYEVGQHVYSYNIKPATDNLHILEDSAGWDGSHSKHQKYVFATLRKCIGDGHTITELRKITAIEWWELLSNKDELYTISDSLMTPEFIEYMKYNHPEINIGLPKIMTGKQFKEYYPGVFIRLFTEERCHNGHQWELGLNKCKNFDPSIECGQGFYFIYEHQKDRWLEYNGKKMYWWSYVIIPDHTTVAVIDNGFNNEIKFKVEDIEIPKFIKL